MTWRGLTTAWGAGLIGYAAGFLALSMLLDGAQRTGTGGPLVAWLPLVVSTVVAALASVLTLPAREDTRGRHWLLAVLVVPLVVGLLGLAARPEGSGLTVPVLVVLGLLGLCAVIALVVGPWRHRRAMLRRGGFDPGSPRGG